MNRRELLTGTIAAATTGALGVISITEADAESVVIRAKLPRPWPTYFGHPGIGKSHTTMHLASEMGLPCIDLKLVEAVPPPTFSFPNRPRNPFA